jgi:leucine efflux protein leuE
MNGISDLPQYLIGVIAVILVPGPNSLYCLSVAGQHGSRAAYRAIAGILLGDSLLILATVFGAGALLHRYPYLFHGIKIAGGLYLAWLGLNLLKGGWLAWQTRRNTAPVTQKVAPRRIFHHALTLSLMNPKAILFFLSFFTQFVRADAPNPLYSFLILALILQSVSFTYLNILAFAGMRLTAVFARSRALAAVGMTLVGLLFIAFAVKLWTASL